ncbi:ankyrin repeat-containing domain protein [Clohesyomyces aquaticus]|uniref:Ankyrin repeat-containing domain protein n=1 Tax=Clohesyomyces aquaticus TaxID=1231657 RepID=A0A1Y1XW05_9PLEO|nr:ankyrin repeat-containing domain protein [Clohesyomyces aquaticus]
MHLCFENGCISDHIEKHSRGPTGLATLILALQEYPRSEGLVQLLLDHGCNPDVTALCIMDHDVGEESVTALMWALAQPQKTIASSVIVALLAARASPIRPTPKSDLSPVALASREGRQDIVQELLNRGADASVRDKWNRSALFYAASTSFTSVVQTLSIHALKDDGSLHEAARCLQLDAATILIKHGHNPNFPSRLHNGRNALGELCLNASITNSTQRSRLRKLIRLLLDAGANANFKARNEKSTIFLALDNPHSALDISDALLETEVWESLNSDKNMFRDAATGLWYSPIKYVELVPSHSREREKTELLELLRDKGCEPKFYSEGHEQPAGAIGMPDEVKRLADRQREHALSLQLATEENEHARSLEEARHRDTLRRQQEAQAAWTTLEAQKHEFEMQRVRSAERMKRQEKVAWHTLQVEQERDFAAQRLEIEEKKTAQGLVNEGKMIKMRKDEVEYRAGVERRMLKEKEELYERNVKRQLQVTKKMDESAQLHAKLRMERPAIEAPPGWGPD